MVRTGHSHRTVLYILLIRCIPDLYDLRYPRCSPPNAVTWGLTAFVRRDGRAAGYGPHLGGLGERPAGERAPARYHVEPGSDVIRVGRRGISGGRVALVAPSRSKPRLVRDGRLSGRRSRWWTPNRP
jgi:hypothetical protein